MARLRSSALVVPTRGVRAAQLPASAVDTIRGIAAGIERPFAVSHLSAALVMGMPVPRRFASGLPVHVMRPTQRAQTHRPSVISHRGLERRRVVRVRGLPVVDPLDTWCDLARMVPADELVVIGDWLMSRGASTGDFVATLGAHGGERGIRAARGALPLIRAGSRSRMETLARLMFVGAGLPEPELNADVHDDHGQWILCADFLWRAQRVVAEYQGDHHRVDRRQWQFDIARRRLAEVNSWTVVDITAHDVFDAFHRSQVVGRLSHLLLG